MSSGKLSVADPYLSDFFCWWLFFVLFCKQCLQGGQQDPQGQGHVLNSTAAHLQLTGDLTAPHTSAFSSRWSLSHRFPLPVGNHIKPMGGGTSRDTLLRNSGPKTSVNFRMTNATIEHAVRELESRSSALCSRQHGGQRWKDLEPRAV